MTKDSASAYLHMGRDTPLPLYVPVHILNDPSPFPQVAYVLIRWPISQQKTNTNIRISYSLKYKHSKQNSLRKNKW